MRSRLIGGQLSVTSICSAGSSGLLVPGYLSPFLPLCGESLLVQKALACSAYLVWQAFGSDSAVQGVVVSVLLRQLQIDFLQQLQNWLGISLGTTADVWGFSQRWAEIL